MAGGARPGHGSVVGHVGETLVACVNFLESGAIIEWEYK